MRVGTGVLGKRTGMSVTSYFGDVSLPDLLSSCGNAGSLEGGCAVTA